MLAVDFVSVITALLSLRERVLFLTRNDKHRQGSSSLWSVAFRLDEAQTPWHALTVSSRLFVTA